MLSVCVCYESSWKCLSVFGQGCETVSSQAAAPTGWMLVEIVKFSFTSVAETHKPVG